MRIFGYFIDGIGRYLTNESLLLKNPDIHQFCELDENFNFVRKIENTSSTYWKHPQHNSETPWLEDGRLVLWNGTLYLSSTVCYQECGKWASVGLEIQALEDREGGVAATHFWNTLEHGINGIQKNWMPIPDRPFNYIVGTSTHGSQHIDISTGRVVNVGQTATFDFYRGSTPLVKDGNGYVTITHKVEKGGESGKTYWNYLTRYDDNLLPVAFSRPFKFTNTPIEFVTTLTRNADGEVVVGVTSNDDTPEVHIYEEAEFFKQVGMCK